MCLAAVLALALPTIESEQAEKFSIPVDEVSQLPIHSSLTRQFSDECLAVTDFMLDPNNNIPPFPTDAVQPAIRLDDVASQLTDQGSGPEAEGADNAPKSPEVVFIESSDPGPETVRTPADTDLNLKQLADLTAQATADPSEELQVESYVELRDESEMTSCFGVDPFAMAVDGEAPAMPTIPLVDAMTREILARKNDDAQHGWRLMPFEAKQARAGEQFETTATGEGEVSLENGNKDCFYAKPGDVVFVDGNLGFDHIDLSVYEIDHATFQPDAILLFVDADAIASVDPDVSPKPITIRHRGVGYAIFKGGVRVDL